MTLADIPEDFLERHMRLTQYISCEAHSILAKGIRRVETSSGGITAILRRLWGYDTILKELNFEIYKSRGETETILIEGVPTERIANWSKRNDHRHHALDALVVACTCQGYIQRLNRLNTEEYKQSMRDELKETEGKHADQKQLPDRWLRAQPHFAPHVVQDKVAEILISFHPGGKTYSRGRNIIKRKGERFVQEGILVPRGELWEATLYGSIQQKELQRFVYKCSLQKLKEANLKSIVDQRLRGIIAQRLAEHGNDPKKAFAEPLYSDRAQTQQVRSVRCFAKFRSGTLVPLRHDAQGKAKAFIAPGNNHHVAFYTDSKGQLREYVSSFCQVIERVRFGLPPIIYNPRATMEQALTIAELPGSVLKALPPSDWSLKEFIRKGDSILLGMSDEEIAAALEAKDYILLSLYLYCVRSASGGDYWFRHHLETNDEKKKNAVGNVPKFHRKRSPGTYTELNPRKVKIDRLGRISLL